MNGTLAGRLYQAGTFGLVLVGVSLLVLLGALSGCLVYEVASAPVKIAAKTVQIAGITTVAVVETSGKAAVSAVRATGAVSTGGMEASARLVQVGMVTFSDQASGVVVRVPWAKGLTLLAASNAAKMDIAQSAVRLLRDGQPAYLGTQRSRGELLLHSGDVVRVER